MRIDRVDVAIYRIPTDRPEADGTYAWDSTTMAAVHVRAAGERGFGYTYGSSAIAALIRDQLAPRVVGRDPLAIEGAWNAMVAEVRNVGRAGIASTAISAIDAALWDLKAKLLGLPLVTLLGSVREAVPIYGSGGFTTYSTDELARQLVGWRELGIHEMKMKIGSDPNADAARVAAAREAVGDEVALMVDANGAYSPARAIEKARAFAEQRVVWFEEPVSSDDLEGMRLVREHAPPGMAIAAGEYGWDSMYFRRMLASGAIDVLQADATRCLGVTGFLAAARLCQAHCVPLSAHTAPSLHLHLGCAATPVVHLEYFHDHARIERMLFDGFVTPRDGVLHPDRSRPGIGVELIESEAERYRV